MEPPQSGTLLVAVAGWCGTLTLKGLCPKVTFVTSLATCYMANLERGKKVQFYHVPKRRELEYLWKDLMDVVIEKKGGGFIKDKKCCITT